VTVDLPFEEIWLHDFEFVPQPGERPDVVCLAAHELCSGRTLRLWRDELGGQPPYRTDGGVLFVSFVANAECACHLALGWPMPARVLDLSPAFRNLTNGRSTPEGKGLLGALRYFGLDTISAKLKDSMQQRVMQGWPFTPAERERILKYCASDIDALARLLPRILAAPDFNLGVALYHGEFAAVSALMEHHGVPMDMEIFPQLADEGAWRAARDAVTPEMDAAYGVYARNAAGDWVFSMELFEAYLARAGIDWPRLETGKLNTKQKTFENMCRGRPQLETLRQLRFIRSKMRKVKLAVGADGRNRTVLWPFKAKTSRTQPKAAQWILSPAVWLRSLIKPGPGMAVAYIDFSSAEFGIAASISDGHCGPTNTMLDMYMSGDPYTAFMRRVGVVLPDGAKHAIVRHQYKIALLAVLYGMTAEALANRLGWSVLEAHELIGQHRELFAQYWRWSDDWTAHALQTGTMSTAFGWTCRTGITEFGTRSIANFPIQATCAEILRISCILAARHGIEIVAPVHDAVLIEAPIERIEADVALMREIMRRASRIVLGKHELRTDAKIVRYPDRYRDARDEGTWDSVLGHLAEYRRKQDGRLAQEAIA
jgi:DNA polymerase-1